MDTRRSNPSAPPAYKPAQQIRPAAPPVFSPAASPRSLQPKSAIPALLRVPAAGIRPAAAPPVYNPYQKPCAVQPRVAAPPVYRPQQWSFAAQPKFAAPVRAATIQLSSKKRKGFSSCDASVVGSKKTGTGSYKNSIHGEINALEDYLTQGGKLKDITEIRISSQPCKYCHLILKDLGLRDLVVITTDDEREYGSCQGGSYGFFWSEGYVSKELQKAKGLDQEAYLDDMIKRKDKL